MSREQRGAGNGYLDINTGEELDGIRSGTRTPRPYHHDAGEIQQDLSNDLSAASTGRSGSHGPLGSDQDGHLSGHLRQLSYPGSQSGTEADDERPNYVKALPAPHLRPHKGLKTGEQNEDVLLTPSQLDDEGRRLSKEYFGVSSQAKQGSEQDEDEQKKLLRRRLAEFARRSSEVALMAVIVACVLCGKGVLRQALDWRWELASQAITIISLVLVYPVKLSIVDTQSQARKLWQRFRVPASFDPATVLYPPLLPVLVALLIAPANSAVILPNIVLGLSALPQRLFPRSSRLSGLNALHWLVSVVPVIVSDYTTAAMADCVRDRYTLQCPASNGLTAETLVSLYPLHHLLLAPLHFLTTTSLLISELHLLSIALINVLLLAQSPQAVMLKACLWIGGIPILVLCAPLLQWNVALMRVPKWKLRRPGYSAEERKSLVDAVSDLLNVQRATAAFKSSVFEGSDADEDEPPVSIKKTSRPGRPKLSLSKLPVPAFDSLIPTSAVEPTTTSNGTLGGMVASARRPRSSTLPSREAPALAERQTSSSWRRKQKSPYLPWYLHLTPEQAQRRKRIYMLCVYITMLITIIVPVRQYVQDRALASNEPIGWAVGYIVGQVQGVHDLLQSLRLDRWVAWPAPPGPWQDIALTWPLKIPAMRSIIGAANVRILLVGYWASILAAGLLAVFSLTSFVEVDTRRKVFHGVMVAMMLPATFVDPCACALALTLILAAFLLLEIIRAGQVQPLGNAISRFVAPYVDGRDLRGPVVVSHLFLLIGCAVPMWFSLASIERAGDSPWQGWELQDEQREVAMVAGIICVGMGDAAASLIGRRYGRHKWIWVGGKSLEGSAAFAAAVTAGLVAAKVWLVVGGWTDGNGTLDGHWGHHASSGFAIAWTVTLVKAIICACGSSFMEAVLTGANDNVVVPVALWLLVKGLRV